MLIYKKALIYSDPLFLFIFSNYVVKNTNDNDDDDDDDNNKSRWSIMSPGR